MDEATLRRRAHSVAELRRLARRRLPRMVFDFVDGGAEEERTLRANEDAFAELDLWPRPLNGTDAEVRPQAVRLLGLDLRLPVGIGPTGISGMLWPDGELAAARAAAAAGTLYVTSHGSSAPPSRAAAATASWSG